MLTTVQSQIHDLAQQKLVPRRGDCLAFVEQLLEIATYAGPIRCTLAREGVLRFETRDLGCLEISVDPAKSRLRTMCARLAYLCHLSGQEFEPYGGEGMIKGSAVTGQTNHDTRAWHVRYKNTTGAQEFTITAVEDTNSCP
jgi:hypothetical protein